MMRKHQQNLREKEPEDKITTIIIKNDRDIFLTKMLIFRKNSQDTNPKIIFTQDSENIRKIPQSLMQTNLKIVTGD